MALQLTEDFVLLITALTFIPDYSLFCSYIIRVFFNVSLPDFFLFGSALLIRMQSLQLSSIFTLNLFLFNLFTFLPACVYGVRVLSFFISSFIVLSVSFFFVLFYILLCIVSSCSLWVFLFVYFPPRLVSHQAAKITAFEVWLRNRKIH